MEKPDNGLKVELNAILTHRQTCDCLLSDKEMTDNFSDQLDSQECVLRKPRNRRKIRKNAVFGRKQLCN